LIEKKTTSIERVYFRINFIRKRLHAVDRVLFSIYDNRRVSLKSFLK
jgi:hypothetical protein